MSTQNERANALRRLKKILALTSSSNPGEAAAALQQARTIMDKFGLDAVDAEASTITEERFKMGSADVTGWRSSLVAVIKYSLGVEVLIELTEPAKGHRRPSAKVVFIGEGHKPKIAAYALSVLQRSISKSFVKATEDMIRGALPSKDVKEIKKLLITQKHRDAYAKSWCHSVRSKVASLDNERSPAMKRYMEKFSVEKTAEEQQKVARSRSRKDDPLTSFFERQGYRDGKNVQLNKAMDSGPEQQRLL
jgi:hypothetical protein